MVRSLDFFLKFSKNHDFSNQNTASGDPPFDPPFSFLEKATSQLSLEKKNRKKILKSRNFKWNSILEALEWYLEGTENYEKWIQKSIFGDRCVRFCEIDINIIELIVKHRTKNFS